MLNRKLTLALFIFVFLIVWGVVFYDYYKKQNSVSDQNILTGNVISDLGNLDTFQLSPINLKKCILSSQCGSGNKCDKGYCRPYVSCKVKGKKLPLNSYCLSPPLGSNAYGVCGNSGYCQAECQKDKDCKRSKNGDLCNIQYGRCADCLTNSDCKVSGYTCDVVKGKCISSDTNPPPPPPSINYCNYLNSGGETFCKSVGSLMGKDLHCCPATKDPNSNRGICEEKCTNIPTSRPDIPDENGQITVTTDSTNQDENLVCKITKLCDDGSNKWHENIKVSC